MDTNTTVLLIFKNLCVIVLWTKVALPLEGLNHSKKRGCYSDHLGFEYRSELLLSPQLQSLLG